MTAEAILGCTMVIVATVYFIGLLVASIREKRK
jgi:hypothetical protein